jgi:hypothetical protein
MSMLDVGDAIGVERGPRVRAGLQLGPPPTRGGAKNVRFHLTEP